MSEDSHPLRVAWFSPLDVAGDQSPSVSAYASAELLPLLREEFEIDLFHNDFQSYLDFPTYHYLSAFLHHRERPYDIFFYQVEDRISSNFIRQYSGVVPGIVWFHDFLFTHHGPEPVLNSPWEEVIGKYNDDARPWPARGTEFDERGPIGVREGGLSFGTLFSSEIGHSEFRRNVEQQLGGKDVRRSAYLPLPAATTAGVRDDFSSFERICFCGSPRIEHRAHKFFQALSELDNFFQLTWLIEESERSAAEELLREFSLVNATLVSGRCPRKWAELVTDNDIAVHSLFSVYGQLGPYLATSLSAGLPCFVTDFASAEFLPDSLLFKIRPGNTEVTEFASVLRRLRDGEIRHNPAGAREFADGVFHREIVAAELAAFFRSSRNDCRTLGKRWSELEQQARDALLGEVLSRSVEQDPVAEQYSQSLRPVFAELGWTC